MADYRAIWAVSESIVNLLRTSDKPTELQPAELGVNLEFKVFSTRDFGNNTTFSGASLFPYRIYVNGTHRTPPGSFDANGNRLKHRLPVEVHFLITVWGKDSSLQNTLAGWIMRVLEDTTTLPSGILNSVIPGAFLPEETVDVCLAELTTEDLFRIWDVIGLNTYHLSIPYVAKIIEIDSTQIIPNENSEVVQYQKWKYVQRKIGEN